MTNEIDATKENEAQIIKPKKVEKVEKVEKAAKHSSNDDTGLLDMERLAKEHDAELIDVVDYVDGVPNEVLMPTDLDVKEALQDASEDTGYSQFVKTDYTREKIVSLRVSADEPEVTPEERKRRVKKLAGAISHSLRLSGEINIRCFGRDAITKGSKALAIAKDYLSATHKNLQLSFSPAFIQTEINGNKLTGIGFFAFVTDSDEAYPDIENVKSKLFVKADPQDTDAEVRRINVRKLAGAITHSVEENQCCVVRCFGKDSIAKAAKAIAIARGFVATKGPDLYCWNQFIIASMNGNERTGIAYYCYANG